MTDTLITILSWVFVAAGSGFIVVGALGLVRMPDLFTRMHAASVIETLGAVLLVIGLMLQAGLSLVSAEAPVRACTVLFHGARGGACARTGSFASGC